ncbi:hypothetical protein N9N97_01400, partial [Rickettsiaceae bacterium]|nr:hypothetical protein [Rickettsiaceae bacterium]
LLKLSNSLESILKKFDQSMYVINFFDGCAVGIIDDEISMEGKLLYPQHDHELFTVVIGKAVYSFNLVLKNINNFWATLNLQGYAVSEIGDASYSWRGSLSVQNSAFKQRFVRSPEFEENDALLKDVR